MALRLLFVGVGPLTSVVDPAAAIALIGSLNASSAPMCAETVVSATFRCVRSIILGRLIAARPPHPHRPLPLADASCKVEFDALLHTLEVLRRLVKLVSACHISKEKKVCEKDRVN